MVDFFANHHCLELTGNESGLKMNEIEISPWILKFNNSSTETLVVTGILIESPIGTKTILSFNLGFKCTNNLVEYEALLICLQILLELGAK